jgi:hypothetical protein
MLCSRLAFLLVLNGVIAYHSKGCKFEEYFLCDIFVRSVE